MSLCHITLPWKNFEHRELSYVNEPFNNLNAVSLWRELGYTNTMFTGDMYDMQNPWPVWLDMTVYEKIFGWKQLSWSFYRMTTGTILPNHSDTYQLFKTLHPKSVEHTICRAIVFLEDWSPGHILTLGDRQVDQWIAGDYVEWEEYMPHLAANVGLEDRYTLQLTGYK